MILTQSRCTDQRKTVPFSEVVTELIFSSFCDYDEEHGLYVSRMLVEDRVAERVTNACFMPIIVSPLSLSLSLSLFIFFYYRTVHAILLFTFLFRFLLFSFCFPSLPLSLYLASLTSFLCFFVYLFRYQFSHLCSVYLSLLFNPYPWVGIDQWAKSNGRCQRTVHWGTVFDHSQYTCEVQCNRLTNLQCVFNSNIDPHDVGRVAWHIARGSDRFRKSIRHSQCRAIHHPGITVRIQSVVAICVFSGRIRRRLATTTPTTTSIRRGRFAVRVAASSSWAG